ncbi:hypothetical protein OFB61_23375, partial [Escherichia coli]|nr:hypothetical protein [Escherichia coli]
MRFPYPEEKTSNQVTHATACLHTCIMLGHIGICFVIHPTETETHENRATSRDSLLCMKSQP